MDHLAHACDKITPEKTAPALIAIRHTRVPPDGTAHRDWACFRSVGPFAFDEAGIVASLIGPISARNIGVFVLCTFDGEHILYPTQDSDHVREALKAEGHVFVE